MIRQRPGSRARRRRERRALPRGGDVEDPPGGGRPHRHPKTVMARCPVRHDPAMTKRHDAPAPPLP